MFFAAGVVLLVMYELIKTVVPATATANPNAPQTPTAANPAGLSSALTSLLNSLGGLGTAANAIPASQQLGGAITGLSSSDELGLLQGSTQDLASSPFTSTDNSFGYNPTSDPYSF
jgi:hypothetical protein